MRMRGVVALLMPLVFWGGCDAPKSNQIPSGSPDGGEPDGFAAAVDDGGRIEALDAPSPITHRLCDGRPGLVFSFVRTSNLAKIAPGEAVIYENGAAFLHIAGDCTFWAFEGTRTGSSGNGVDIRTGKLTAEDEARLDEELQLSTWQVHAGRYYKSTLHDATPDWILRHELRIGCDALCFWNREAPELNVIYRSVLERLYQVARSGQSVNDDVRISLVPASEPPNWSGPWADWPLDQPVASFVRPAANEAPGTSILVRQPEAGRLRLLRRDYAAGRFGNIAFIPVKEASSGVLHALNVRDTIPLEDGNGLIPAR